MERGESVKRFSFTYAYSSRKLTINQALTRIAVDWRHVYVHTPLDMRTSRTLTQYRLARAPTAQANAPETGSAAVRKVIAGYARPTFTRHDILVAAQAAYPDAKITRSTVSNVFDQWLGIYIARIAPEALRPRVGDGSFWARNEHRLAELADEIKRAFRSRCRQVRTDLEENHEEATKLIEAYEFCRKQLRRRGVEMN